MHPLSSGAFVFRPFAPADASAFVAAVHESLSTVGKWMPWAHANYSLADANAWFTHCDQERERATSYEFGMFEATSGALVCGCGLNQFNPLHGFCNLGYWVRESQQRQGAALAAVDALSRFGFSELKLGRIEIVVATGNTASMALATKAGAQLECLARNRLKVDGTFFDAHVFSLVSAVGC